MEVVGSIPTLPDVPDGQVGTPYGPHGSSNGLRDNQIHGFEKVVGLDSVTLW